MPLRDVLYGWAVIFGVIFFAVRSCTATPEDDVLGRSGVRPLGNSPAGIHLGGVAMSGRKGPRQPTFDSRDPLLGGRVDGTLDLHGFGATEAPSAVRTFLETWQRRKNGALVHIITGKGKGSANGPVLRGLVKGLLQGELRAMVAEWGMDDGEGGYRVRVR
jgi:hypothetical protein